jgi:hypothetical protein
MGFFSRIERHTGQTFTAPKDDYVPKKDVPDRDFPDTSPSPQLQDEYVLLVMKVLPRERSKVDAKRLTEADMDRVRALGFPLYALDNKMSGMSGMPDWTGAGNCLTWHSGRWYIF